jgi:NADPH:quinone reductase-like Zn-dependent oxidoreductase
MKAVVYSEYGGPEVLRQVDIEKPTAADNEILVKVHAAAVNPVDWHFMRGTPYPIRLGSGLRKPKSVRRLGFDYAGTIDAVGRSVTQFNVGDAVFGGRPGALAEYLTVPVDRGAVRKPERLTFEEAAAVPLAGMTALQALRNKAQVQRGQKVLINGASGGVGTFAVQLAKAFGADVTGVQSTRNLEMVRSIGADHVIDYTREDFTTTGERYDVIIDNVGNRSLSEVRRVLKPGGTYVANGAGGPEDGLPVGRIVQMLVMSPFISQKIRFFVMTPNRDDLQLLADLMQAGKVTPMIDRRYAFSEVANAIRHLESGRARGKVVVNLAPDRTSKAVRTQLLE